MSWVQDNGERYARWLTLPNVLLIACVVVAIWFVFVPLSALLYNAFTEDTGFGPGAFSLDNFVEAYSSWHILRLFRNSLVFAVATAVTTFVMGALVAWVVERTDAPGASLFHTLSLMSFAVPGLLMAMAWIFVLSPNIGWGNAVLKAAFGLGEAAPGAEHQRNAADQNEADGPHGFQVEPAPRNEFEAEIAVDQPRQAAAGRDHRGGVDGGDQHGHSEIGVDQAAGGLVASVEIGSPA